MYLGARDFSRAIANNSKRAFPIIQSSTSRPRPKSDQTSLNRASRPGYHVSVGGWMDLVPYKKDFIWQTSIN